MNLRKHDNIFSGILLLSFIAIMIPKELHGIELNQYLWKNRIILTFADDEDHADLIKLKVEMKQLRMIIPLEYCSSERTEVLSMNPNDPFP